MPRAKADRFDFVAQTVRIFDALSACQKSSACRGADKFLVFKRVARKYDPDKYRAAGSMVAFFRFGRITLGPFRPRSV